MKYVFAALFVIVGALAVWLLRDAPQMPTESAAAAKRSIERSAQIAEANRAEMLYQGKGVPRDVPEAVRLWERAAQNDITQAWRRLADVYSTGDGVPVNATRAVEAWRHVAETGDVDGGKKLAWAYWTGWGTDRNPAAAAAIWQRFVEYGDVEAKYWLGEALMAGEGVPRDAAKAVELWRSACVNNFVRDCWHALCRALADGVGTERDVVAAAHWCRQGASAVDTTPRSAAPFREQTASRVRMDKKRQDAIDAKAVLQRSVPEIESRARKGESGAQFEFAIHQTDPVAKRMWFERAAAQGHAEAAKVVEQMKRQSPFRQ